MKFSFNFVVLLLVTSCYFSYATPALQDSTGQEMQEGYYIVIGAYSPRKEAYAQRYVEKVTKMGHAADYGFNSKKDLYFVYLDFTENYRASIAGMRETRKIEQFHDAWVFVCLGGNGKMSVDKEENPSNESIANDTAERKEKADEGHSDTEETLNNPDVNEENPVTEIPVDKEENDPVDEAEKTLVDKEDILIKDEGKPKKIENLSDVSVFFNLVNARNFNDVEGEVQIIDSERSKLLEVVKGGDYVRLRDPNNGTGELILICDVFGFRKTQKEINYYHPLRDTTSQDVDLLSDVYLVNFPLIRYHVGDIVTMYNVYFFRDASIMRPESKYEVNNLLAMLKENQDYRIRIHGHTNGNNPGKIISKGDSELFYALDDEHNKNGFGSAKELSEQRAEAIRDYLISEGISGDRMETKAWGGKRMLYNKFSSQAKENVRVEIEILEE